MVQSHILQGIFPNLLDWPVSLHTPINHKKACIGLGPKVSRELMMHDLLHNLMFSS